jgi:filamentous hemagglutinin family protein
MKPIRFGKRFQKWIMSLLLPAFAMTGAPVQANPRGGVVIHGAADIAKMAGNQLRINQQSSAVIINWQDFSIDKGEVTRFVQPNNGTALNRVTSGNISQIYGQLKGNANVYVINPNGIVVGASGVVDVAGNAVLSTLDIDDNDFLDGGPGRFYGDSSTGVTNFGTISSTGGDVVLMGGFVSNQGQIGALNGNVAIGAGGDILLQEGGSGSTISVRGSSDYTGTGIENKGSIRGASAELKAHGNVYALAINNTGAIRATGADRSNGRVRLTSSGSSSNINLGQGSTIMARAGADGGSVAVEAPQGIVNVAGRIDAVGSNAGGSVSVAGRQVTQAATSVIDASGANRGGGVAIDAVETTTLNGSILAGSGFGAGGEIALTGGSILINDSASVSVDGFTKGGRIRVGGDFQGNDTGLREAQSLRVEGGASLSADSMAGDAGTVIAWANGDTIFLGDVSASAKGPVGNGGLVEVSGKEYLYFDGSVGVSAVNGLSGTVLFDPGTVVIGAVGTSLPPLTSPAIDSTISIGAINSTLQGGANVLVVTGSGSIIFDSVGGGGTDDTTVAVANDRNSAVQWTNSLSSFGAFASGSILVNNHIRTSGAGSINLLAGWTGSEGDATLALSPQAAWDSYVGSGSFGNGGGSVFVGSSTMIRHVEVGSRFGDTNIAGFDVRVTGSDTTTTQRFAMIGFRDGGQIFAPALNRGTAGGVGTPEIRLDMRVGLPTGTGAWLLSDGRNFVDAAGVPTAANQAAAGVGDPIVAVAGQFEVDINGDGIVDGVRGINSTGAVAETFIPYASHYNSVTSGNWWWQQIEATGSTATKDPLGLGALRPEYGAGVGALSVAALGLGAAVNGADINVLAKGNVVVQAGSGTEMVGAMIGHGGPNRVNASGAGISQREIGNETVGNVAFSITGIQGNQMERRWSFNGSNSDRVSTSIARLAPVYGNINVMAGVAPGTGVGVNHSAGTVTATMGTSGNVIVQANQTFKVTGSAANSAAQIGHGGLGQFGEYYGGIRVEAGGSVNIFAGEGTRSTASIGHTFTGHSEWNPPSNADQQLRFFATAGDFDNTNLRKGELFTGIATTGFNPVIDPVEPRRYSLARFTLNGTPGTLTITIAPGNTGNYVPEITAGNLTGRFVNINPDAVVPLQDRILNYNPAQYTRGLGRDIGAGTSTQGTNTLAPLDLAPVGPVRVAALDGSVINGLHGNIKVGANTGNITLKGAMTEGITVSAARDRRFASIGHGGSNFAVGADGSGYQNALVGVPNVPGSTGDADARDIVTYHVNNGNETITGSRAYYGAAGTNVNRALVFMSITGDIDVRAGGNVSMIAGNDIYSHTQIGHGGAELADYETSSFILGDISVAAGGNVDVIGGGGVQLTARDGDYDTRAWSQIGHGGYRTGFFGYLGDIKVTAGANVLVRNGAFSYTYAKIGHQGVEDWGQAGGNYIRKENFYSYGSSTDIFTTLTSNLAQVQYVNQNGHSGSVVGLRNFAPSGAGTLVGSAMNTADITVLAGGDVTLNHMQMGQRQPQARLTRLGVDLSNPAFNVNNQGLGIRTRTSNAQIGHGGNITHALNVDNIASNYADKSGNISVQAGGSVLMTSGEGELRWTRIGHGIGRDQIAGDINNAGYSRAVELIGNISVVAGSDIRVDASAADENERPENFNATFGSAAPSRWNPVVIGHGAVDNSRDVVVLSKGEDANGLVASSNITTVAGGNMSILGGKGVEASFAQVGHGFNSDLGDDTSRRFGIPTGFAGDITVGVTGNLFLEAGANAWSQLPSGIANNEGQSVTGAFAAIGHGGYQLDAPSFGDIRVFVGNDLGIVAQRRTDPGTTTSGVSPYTIRNPSIGSDAVSSAFNFAKIGHFAVENGNRQANSNDIVRDANQEGDITVVVGRDLSLAGGRTPNVDTQTIYGAFAQIGHGGPAAIGNLLGDVTVLVKRDLSVVNGSKREDGTITVTPLNNYAMIGNGDNVKILPPISEVSLFRAEANGFRFGNIVLAAGRGASFDGALIGHADPATSSQITTGRTQVAVSRLNPFFGGNGTLTAVNGTVFSSGGMGSEQMEFYLPARSNNLMSSTTRINEGAATFATAPGNFAAPFNKANGIFAGRADEVYLTPDLWWDQSGLAATGGFSGAGVFPTDGLSGQGGALALVNSPGGLANLDSLVAGSLGDSAPAYRASNGVSGTGLYTIYYDAIEFVSSTFPAPPTQPTGPTIPDPGFVFNFDGLLFTDTYDSLMRDDELLNNGYGGGGNFLYNLLSMEEIEQNNDDDNEERRERRRGGAGPVGLTYYVYEPGTNRYSSYRVFGIPASTFPPLN